MIAHDLIKNELDDPDIKIKEIGNDEKGDYAHIVVVGARPKLYRLIGDKFDVDGKVQDMPEGVHAKVRPKW